MSRIDDAFAAAPRADFLPPDQRHLAGEDRPLPIGYGVTNSQPWTVDYMLTHLDVQPGDRVLDVGSGSGWTTALLAELTGPDGTVTGVEIVPQLVTFGSGNLGDRYPNARIVDAIPGVMGLPEAGPFDRILVSADAGSIPEELEDQLARGGRMVLPAAGEMTIVERSATGEISRRQTGTRFSFVPLH
ncbi:protein-L-isoaspartate O-methyltransferase [Gordonia hirsuta DSM 44140 = NBRC 16056]|uniref:Protein-L-isoaspartate O-methyltransferase n=1 Tax=Gordonia hirsuta DSM 44140 = NBRC 16056 TaxID=1121927 RepID=L7LAQ5_9ACTN|nr:protein-L-isoaspartate O-methyltransferase [Gordonia hirsuta]GAC58225.1 protein-L-isoaspartate O-methyltransferase [Gordonia hirsuta DSM 44140 = NBRC 16056]